MENTVALLTCAVVVYIVMTVCACIPICIVARKATKERRFSQATERIISFCNCMAGGVFIAMCFLGLLPYAKDKTALVLRDLEVKTDFPVAEFLVVIGFFLIMTIEQSVIAYQDARKREKSSQQVWNTSHQSRQEKPATVNYFNSPDDDDSCTQLLGESPLDAASPESPSTPTDSAALRLYQNVPMVMIGGQEESKSLVPSPTLSKAEANQIISCHQHTHKLIEKPQGTLRFMVLYMAVSIHSLFEGMALGLQTDQMRIFHLFFAILFHEALVAFSVGITMARQANQSHHGLSKSIKYVLIFCISVPLGVLIGLAIQQTPGTAGSIASAFLQSLATGIFIHVTFLELVPTEFANHKDRLAKVAFHFLGFLALTIVTITMGSHH